MDDEAAWAWVAGVFEGEGNIHLHSRNSVELRVSMTDQDVVQRLHEITGVGRLWGPRRYGNQRQPQLYWLVGPRLEVLTVLDRIEPYLGERRAERARAARARLAGCRPMNAGICKRGHLLSGENLYQAPGGQQHCRQCARVREAARAR